MSKQLLLLVSLVTLAGICLSQSTPWDPSFDILSHLATKSPYAPQDSFSNHTPPPASCVPRHLNLINRHGNRNPGDGDIEEYIRLEGMFADYSPVLRFDWMRSFKNPVAMEDEGKLVVKGMMELYDLAKRFKNAYPEIFKKEYDPDVYFLRATQETRAFLSADSFGFSLFENKGAVGPSFYQPVFILEDTEAQDDVLKYYDNCQLYVDTVGDNDTAIIQAEIYLAKILPAMAQRLTGIITTDGSWKVTNEDVLAFHSLCQTQAAIQGIVDQACFLFLQSELEALEYWEDLDDYWSKYYPYPINYQMAAPLVQDIATSLVNAAKELSSQATNLRFAHSSTVVPLGAVFGLYRDSEELRADTRQEVIDSRVFRTSQVSPMGTNFAVVLYSCDGGLEHLVKVLHNEREVVVKGCDDVFCPLADFLKAYDSYITQDFDALCQNK